MTEPDETSEQDEQWKAMLSAQERIDNEFRRKCWAEKDDFEFITAYLKNPNPEMEQEFKIKLYNVTETCVRWICEIAKTWPEQDPLTGFNTASNLVDSYENCRDNHPLHISATWWKEYIKPKVMVFYANHMVDIVCKTETEIDELREYLKFEMDHLEQNLT